MTLSQPDTFRRAAITTLGCKVNAYESALIAQKLQQDQWTMVSPKDTADLYVINSCTVTAEAGRQTRQEIRRASQSKSSRSGGSYRLLCGNGGVCLRQDPGCEFGGREQREAFHRRACANFSWGSAAGPSWAPAR